MTKFQVGDVVRKIHGKTPMAVTSVEKPYNYIYCKYLHTKGVVRGYARDFVLYEEEENKMKDTLYKVSLMDREFYGVHIGSNSQGEYIIEEKGTGAIHVVRKDSLEEVMPFTVAVNFWSNREENYQVKEGVLKVGDLVICTNTGKLGVVKTLNTKNKNAKPFKGKVLNGVKVEL